MMVKNRIAVKGEETPADVHTIKAAMFFYDYTRHMLLQTSLANKQGELSQLSFTELISG